MINARGWIVVVLVLATVLRVLLSVFNREANDNHLQVVQLILDGRIGLTMTDCHECFHPKLFYYICAALVHALSLTTDSSRLIAGQLLNSVAGLATVGVVGIVLRSAPFQDKWKLWTFALVALNPRLIAINGQLSNDAFAILFATVALWLTLRVLNAPSARAVVAAQLFLSCALMTKGTTWVAAIAIALIFFVRSLGETSWSQSRNFLLLSVVTTLNGCGSVAVAGYDFEHYDVYANMGRGQPLYLWEKTSVGRPGVQSIADGYLTFRFGSLLRDPQITNGREVEHAHRTSVWTQLFAHAHFAQFEQHPPSWLTTDRRILWNARCSLLLGLLPLSFLLVGLARIGFRALNAWRTLGVKDQDYAALLVALVCFGYLAFIIKFSADYRDFAAIKLIYILPGILPFTLVMTDGMQAVCGKLATVKYLEGVLQVALGGLLLSYCVGMGELVLHLANSPQ